MNYAYVRTEDEPLLPPPAYMVGFYGWLRENLFFNFKSTVLTVLFTALVVWTMWAVIDWVFVKAVFSGTGREACVPDGTGMCWPYVYEKFPQWIYGFYPLDQRWRVNLVLLLGLVSLTLMAMPRVPYKVWNALFLVTLYPFISFILMTGGHFELSCSAYIGTGLGLLFLASFMPLLAEGTAAGINRNRYGLAMTVIAILPQLVAIVLAAIIAFAFFVMLGFELPKAVLKLFDINIPVINSLSDTLWMLFDSLRNLSHLYDYMTNQVGSSLFYVSAGLLGLGGLCGLYWTQSVSRRLAVGWLILSILILAALYIISLDLGLRAVETPQWGGLMLTLIVAIIGIVASFPLGILLALGRRSKMPIIRFLSVLYIEIIRGVPLIAVLFMASFMLPLFLPAGMNFNKLLRALVGVALFSAAYTAEIVRGGLQAIPKGQDEAARAVGLSYGQGMGLIILPQALKIVIPSIVNNFIALLKDTTLVSIVGLLDLLGIILATRNDPAWITHSTPATGYIVAGFIFWVACFSMSRYSVYLERRLNTEHRR